jgi:hypothetical protein
MKTVLFAPISTGLNSVVIDGRTDIHKLKDLNERSICQIDDRSLEIVVQYSDYFGVVPVQLVGAGINPSPVFELIMSRSQVATLDDSNTYPTEGKSVLNKDITYYQSVLGPYELFVPDPSDGKASSAIRILFRESGLVFKLFDSQQQELYSAKWWKGDIDKVASHWRMIPSERSLTDEECRLLDSAIAGLKTLANKLD